MRKLKSIFLALGATALLGACSSDRDTYDGFDHSGKNTVSFATNIMKSNIATRATDTDWTKNDAIGIYAINAGGQLGDGAIFDGKANIKHTTAVEIGRAHV